MRRLSVEQDARQGNEHPHRARAVLACDPVGRRGTRAPEARMGLAHLPSSTLHTSEMESLRSPHELLPHLHAFTKVIMTTTTPPPPLHRHSTTTPPPLRRLIRLTCPQVRSVCAVVARPAVGHGARQPHVRLQSVPVPGQSAFGRLAPRTPGAGGWACGWVGGWAVACLGAAV